MTLQVSGAISLNDVATECGIPATGLTMNDARVRFLADKPSGAIAFNNCYSKAFGNTIVAGKFDISINIWGYDSGNSSGQYGSINRANIALGPALWTVQWGGGGTSNDLQFILPGALPKAYFTTLQVLDAAGTLLRSFNTASATSFSNANTPAYSDWRWASPGQLFFAGTTYIIKLL